MCPSLSRPRWAELRKAGQWYDLAVHRSAWAKKAQQSKAEPLLLTHERSTQLTHPTSPRVQVTFSRTPLTTTHPFDSNWTRPDHSDGPKLRVGLLREGGGGGGRRPFEGERERKRDPLYASSCQVLPSSPFSDQGCPENTFCAVYIWGSGEHGGSGVPTELTFAGTRSRGGGASGPVVVTIAAATEAFAALLTDGSVRAWGKSDRGGTSPLACCNFFLTTVLTRFRFRLGPAVRAGLVDCFRVCPCVGYRSCE